MQKSEIRALERLYRRKLKDQLLSSELARYLSQLSGEIGRQIGLLVDRKGNITHVIVGDRQRIVIPDLSYFRYYPGRLKGVRCIHTHFGEKPLDEEDLTDLAMLRLDAMVVLSVEEDGLPGSVWMAYLLPPNPEGKRWDIMVWRHPSEINMNFPEFVSELEDQMLEEMALKSPKGEERAILVSVTTASKHDAEHSMAELVRLAESAGVEVLDTVIQRVHRFNPKYLMGKGKIQELIIRALYLGASMLIFDNELTPVQVNAISELTDLKVIDRTQLILDIFAKRAISREGKIQVELAQLRYMYPRILGKGEAMSRLAGGIGGRGPGETKLEIDRRRIRKRIQVLEQQLEQLKRQRRERRKRRQKASVPVVSLVGYTNAGKTTLLNRLTGADAFAENKLFATLDPSNRVLWLPEVGECILTDTVGFIRNMPEDLMVAFRATLEELEDAFLIVHVVDITSPYMEEEMETVEEILRELELHLKPRLVVYNKADLLSEYERALSEKSGKLLISAKEGYGLDKLTAKISEMLAGVAY
ncbi:GTPase HflX [Thermosulfidibacter takaii]|uniref:GTPase HflX n=1 Tax=Thermosulfidibacter takaii TaxID=412593 RepID=UPI000ADFF9F3|nr:GTPase HflX [Thermosulfidibacter takaii]